jgi:hypothetical protein
LVALDLDEYELADLMGSRVFVFLSVGARPAWQRKASCRGTDSAAWFPSRGDVTTAAKALCAGCPVRPECIAYALDDPRLIGIWGGTSVRDRQRMRRESA